MSQTADLLAFAKRRPKKGFTYFEAQMALQIGRPQPRLDELRARGHKFAEAWEERNGARFKRFWYVGEDHEH